MDKTRHEQLLLRGKGRLALAPLRNVTVEKAAFPFATTAECTASASGVSLEEAGLLPQAQLTIAFGDLRHSARAVRSAICNEEAFDELREDVRTERCVNEKTGMPLRRGGWCRLPTSPTDMS